MLCHAAYSTANQVASALDDVSVAALIACPLFSQVLSIIDWAGFIIVALSILVANNHIPLKTGVS